MDFAEGEYQYGLFRHQLHLERARGHRDDITAWSAQERDIRRVEYRLDQAASYNRPEHVTNLLGPLPERIYRGRAVADRGRGHRGVPHLSEHDGPRSSRPGADRPRTAFPSAHCHDHARHHRIPRSRHDKRHWVIAGLGSIR